MQIAFVNNRLKKICLSEKETRKEFGSVGARILMRRLSQLQDVANLEQLRDQPGHWHELTGDRWGELAVSLEGGNRLVFEPNHDPIPRKPDGGLDWTKSLMLLLQK
jgi:proteic killer suppression protein